MTPDDLRKFPSTEDMKTYSVTDFRRRSNQVFDAAEKEPVCITRHGKKEAVLIKESDFMSLVTAIADLADNPDGNE